MSKLRHPALTDALTERETEVLRLLVEHMSNREIAEKLFLTTGTVKWYMQQLFSKLDVKNRREAIKRTLDLNLLNAPVQVAEDAQPENNLPEPLTAFVGRVTELKDVKRLIFNARLMTLTGPGGIGKTRLALAVAHQLISSFPDGVFFINLAPIRDHTLVIREIARVLEINDTADRPLVDIIGAMLMKKTMLLLIDNFEHVIDAAPKIARLLATAPNLHLLVTSREPLRITGEQEYPVKPLALVQEVDNLQNLQESEAIRLFVQSAQTVRADFQLSTANAPMVIEICRRLDCMPLALELAAARIKLFTPQAILSRLDDRLGFLSGGSRDAGDHQRTLRDSIDWSYSLLNADEQILFHRLSIFAGGCSLEALDSVCSDFSPIKILNILASLVDKSLVRQYDGIGGEPRFSMLETIREYAFECLNGSKEHQQIEERFAHFYLGLVSRAEYEVYYGEQYLWAKRLMEEHGNIRAVLKYFKRTNQIENLQTLIACMGMYWHLNGHAMEGFQWGIEALDLGETPPATRTKLLVLLGGMAYAALSHEFGIEVLEEALTLTRREGDRLNEAWSLGYMSLNYTQIEGARETVKDYLIQSVAIFRELNDDIGLAWTLTSLGVISAMGGEHALSQPYQEESLSLYSRMNNHWGIMLVAQNLGLSYFYQQNYAEAVRLLMRVIEQTSDLRYAFPNALVVLAAIYSALGRTHESVVVLGIINKILDPLGTELSYPERDIRIEVIEKNQALLDAKTYESAFKEGESFNTEDVRHYVKRVNESLAVIK